MDGSPEVPLGPDVVGRNLERALRRAGLTLTELARRSQVPIATLSNVMHGRRKGDNLKTGQVRRLCEVLEISMDWLAGRWHDPSSLAPPGSEAWNLPEPEREAYILRLVADAEMLKRLRITESPDTRSIPEDDP